jgi:hypothetical protein
MALAFFVGCSTSQREVNGSAVSTGSAVVQQAPFSLSVVPTWSGEKAAGITMVHKEARQFYVVLTNVSNQPQVVWGGGTAGATTQFGSSSRQLTGKRLSSPRDRKCLGRIHPEHFWFSLVNIRSAPYDLMMNGRHIQCFARSTKCTSE